MCPGPRGGHACCAVGHKLVVFGGADRNPTTFDDVWVLDTGEPLDPRLYVSSVHLPSHACYATLVPCWHHATHWQSYAVTVKTVGPNHPALALCWRLPHAAYAQDTSAQDTSAISSCSALCLACSFSTFAMDTYLTCLCYGVRFKAHDT